MSTTASHDLVVAALRDGYIIGNELETPREDDSFLHAAAAMLLSNGWQVKLDELRGLSDESLMVVVEAAKVIAKDKEDGYWVPLFPSFPHHIEIHGEAVIFMAQIIHYFTGCRYDENVHAPSDGSVSLSLKNILLAAKPVAIMPTGDYVSRVIDTAGDSATLSPQQIEALRSAIAFSGAPSAVRAATLVSNPVNYTHVPFLAAPGLDKEDFIAILSAPKTVDGLLRVVMALFTEPEKKTRNPENYKNALLNLSDSFSDVNAVRVLPIPSGCRKTIVQRLGEVSGDYRADALQSHRLLWRKIINSIHGGGYAKTPASQRAVNIIYENIEHKTLGSVVENLLREGKPGEAGTLLATHRFPAFLRRLGHIASLSTVHEVEKFAEFLVDKAMSVSLTMLISARNGIANYNTNAKTIRRVAGKANVMVDNKNTIEEKQLAILMDAYTDAIKNHIRSASLTIPDKMGFVDSNTKISTLHHDASFTDRAMRPGMRIRLDDLPDTAYLRGFLAWKGEDIDLDLSGIILDSNFKSIDMVAWNNAYKSDYMVYSGDITSAPNGAVEYIDFNLNTVYQNPEARYIVINVYSYTSDKLSEVDVTSGVMLRDNHDHTDYYDASTALINAELSTPAVECLPFIIDLHTNELIWADTSLGGSGFFRSAKESLYSISGIVKTIIEDKSLTYNELIHMGSDTLGYEISDETTMTPQQVHEIFNL